MPLVLFAGFPSSGKTTWANQLVTKLNEKIASLKPDEDGSNMKVIFHNDESLGITHDMYKESNTEKSARGIQMSAVKRDLSKNNIVILDSMAYNKGFRYQLFCESKTLSTSNCLIQVICPIDTIFELNKNESHKEKWDEELLKQMIHRFEEPDGSKRWDSPLISVSYDDKIETHFDEIWEVLVLRKAPKPNQATILKPAVGTNYLQEMDRLTNYVVNEIVQYIQVDGYGRLKLKNIVDNSECFIDLPSVQVSTAKLQRIKRSFIALNRVRNIETNRIIPLFVEYANNSLNID